MRFENFYEFFLYRGILGRQAFRLFLKFIQFFLEDEKQYMVFGGEVIV